MAKARYVRIKPGVYWQGNKQINIKSNDKEGTCTITACHLKPIIFDDDGNIMEGAVEERV